MKKKILQLILGSITKTIIIRYQPKIIAVTGSVGKTSTKNTISFFLEKFFKVKKSAGNLNTEFGAPLVFLGLEKGGGGSFLEWLKIILIGIKKILIKDKDYPEIIVVEMGADKPGDISYLTKIIKPDISVITMIDENPVHLANYNNLDELVFEKAGIIRNLKESGWAIVNSDDQRALQAAGESKLISFGFNEKNDVKISDFKYEQEEDRPDGISFSLEHDKEKVSFRLPFCFSKSIAYSVATALSCFVCLGIDFKKMPEISRELKPEENRMNLVKGKAYILNDVYNSSPASALMALEALSSYQSQRKIAVLGEMKELGEKSVQLHEKIKEKALESVDVLITIGDENIWQRKENNFPDSEQGALAINDFKINQNDLILVKGSRSMKMEKILKAIS